MTAASRTVRIVDDVAVCGAQILTEAVEAGGHIALTGGAAAMDMYRAARDIADVDWSSATIWFSDERMVPLDDKDSNAGQAHAALLDFVTPRRIEHVRTDLGDPDAAAREYEQRITRSVPDARFDLILLGIGADGHTGSLPPNGIQLEEQERLVTGVAVSSLPPDVSRVSFTLPLMNAAARVVFLVSGAKLARAAHDAFAEAPSPNTPASLVAPTDGELLALLDHAASSPPR